MKELFGPTDTDEEQECEWPESIDDEPNVERYYSEPSCTMTTEAAMNRGFEFEFTALKSRRDHGSLSSRGIAVGLALADATSSAASGGAASAARLSRPIENPRSEGRRRPLVRWGWLTVCLLLAAWIGLGRSGAGRVARSAIPAAAQGAAVGSTHTAGAPARKQLRTIPIESVRVGDRVSGKNPIREQAETIEPDPQTWRKISFQLRKEEGHFLWIDLLRPEEWVELTQAEPGSTVFLNLPELGAVGDAVVISVSSSPAIVPGPGTVVTGTFRHGSEGANVVRLRLEGQEMATGVTSNHPYWSQDRGEFVKVGDLRAGERVNTEFGAREVVSTTPHAYQGLLYNLETTEHVYRVDALGTLVHNDCWDWAKDNIAKLPGSTLWQMLPKLPFAGQTGHLPGYPLPGKTTTSFGSHYFLLKNNWLFDEVHPGGILVSEWLRRFSSLNSNLTPSQIHLGYRFIPLP